LADVKFLRSLSISLSLSPLSYRIEFIHAMGRGVEREKRRGGEGRGGEEKEKKEKRLAMSTWRGGVEWGEMESKNRKQEQ
jgi:hypothetical protein